MGNVGEYSMSIMVMMMDVMGLVTNFVVADWSCEHSYTLILLPPAPGPSASVLPHYGVSNGEWTAVGTFFLQYVPNNSHSFQERDAGGERRVGNEQVLSSIFRGKYKWLGNNDQLFRTLFCFFCSPLSTNYSGPPPPIFPTLSNGEWTAVGTSSQWEWSNVLNTFWFLLLPSPPHD